MGKPTGFMETPRESPPKRPIEERVKDHAEVTLPFDGAKLAAQAARCMDCGIPFCHDGCPLGNRIPDFNDAVYRGDFDAALEKLHATNNFPEFTGRLCPAPCEAACVLGIHADPVTIKYVEREIADRMRDRSLEPQIAPTRSDHRVAIVGSGPAGLACAQELARRGHSVTVFERDDRIGGLLRYGIPDFKMDKAILDARLAQMEAEGVVFEPNVEVGVHMGADELLSKFDAICLAVGATSPRHVHVEGADLAGVHFAMDYLTQSNRANAGDAPRSNAISARDKRVIILGGGDTGADCLGTAIRQGARSVLSLEIAERPGAERGPNEPWPLWPRIFRISPADEEGGERDYAVMTTRFEGRGGHVARLHAVRVESTDGRSFKPIEGTELALDADLVLIAAGFVGPEPSRLLRALGIGLGQRGVIATDLEGRTSAPRVYAAGDAHRGASLVVWAIAEGRRAAHAIHVDLTNGLTAIDGARRTRLPVVA
ncbi:MAG: glutamate synthase subunit beta [Polyangiaceae bacterium]